MNSSSNPARSRRSIRLQGFDYRQNGAYFVTICTHNRAPLFGEIIDDEMRLNEAGLVAWQCWDAIPDHYPHANTDAFVVMPNHVHGIIVIAHTLVGARHASPLQPTHESSGTTLGTIVGSYKSAVTKQINQNRHTPSPSVWQRNYYEHIIRDETSFHDIRRYIVHNPAKWSDDPENPRNSGTPH